MHRGLVLGMCLAAGCVVARLLDDQERPSSPSATGANLVSAAQATEPDRQATLEQLCQGKLKLLDLTWTLNRESAYWPGLRYKPFQLETLATLDKDGVLSKAYSTPEHLGTHLDAPSHFEARGISVDQLRPEQLFAPGVVLDVSGPASLDTDYRLRLEDVQQWEVAHGRIPRGAVVLLHTGWGRHWNHPERYQGLDVLGRFALPRFFSRRRSMVTRRARHPRHRH